MIIKEKYIDVEIISNQLKNLSQIVFEVTDKCNLSCKYCAYGEFYGNYDKRTNKDLSIKQTSIFLDYITNFLKNNPSKSTTKYTYIGFYGGEPLLNMKLIKYVVNYVKKKDIPLLPRESFRVVCSYLTTITSSNIPFSTA